MELRQEFWRHATNEAQKSIAGKFGIYWDDQMQDWDLVMADPSWIPQLLNAYLKGNFTDDEKFAIMELMIASFDDLVASEVLTTNEHWHSCKSILRTEYWLHISTILYWSVPDKQDLDEAFPISKYIRPIWDEVKHHFI